MFLHEERLALSDLSRARSREVEGLPFFQLKYAAAAIMAALSKDRAGVGILRVISCPELCRRVSVSCLRNSVLDATPPPIIIVLALYFFAAATVLFINTSRAACWNSAHMSLTI